MLALSFIIISQENSTPKQGTEKSRSGVQRKVIMIIWIIYQEVLFAYIRYNFSKNVKIAKKKSLVYQKIAVTS